MIAVLETYFSIPLEIPYDVPKIPHVSAKPKSAVWIDSSLGFETRPLCGHHFGGECVELEEVLRAALELFLQLQG